MKFIIVGLPKTGKTMICDCLNSLDNFTVYDEIFVSRLGNKSSNMPDHPLKFMNEIRKRNRGNSFVKWYQEKYKTSINDITKIVKSKDIDGFLNNIFSRNENVGFKLHHHHIEVFPYIIDYIKNNNIKIIHTERENKVKQAIAIIGNRDRITFTKKKIEVNPEAVKKSIEDTNWRNNDLHKWFDNISLNITYEQLTNDRHITELNATVIRDYLSVDVPDFIKVRTVKNTFSKLEDNVINYKDIER